MVVKDLFAAGRVIVFIWGLIGVIADLFFAKQVVAAVTDPKGNWATQLLGKLVSGPPELYWGALILVAVVSFWPQIMQAIRWRPATPTEKKIVRLWMREKAERKEDARNRIEPEVESSPPPTKPAVPINDLAVPLKPPAVAERLPKVESVYEVLVEVERLMTLREAIDPKRIEGTFAHRMAVPIWFGGADAHDMETVRLYRTEFHQRVVAVYERTLEKGLRRDQRSDALVITGPRTPPDIRAIIKYVSYLEGGRA
jgi:hypothetical protein